MMKIDERKKKKERREWLFGGRLVTIESFMDDRNTADERKRRAQHSAEECIAIWVVFFYSGVGIERGGFPKKRISKVAAEKKGHESLCFG